jgi:hypothetical protein
LDFIRAFDSVDRELLWAYLEKLGVAKQLIHVCKKLYERFAMDVEGIFSFLSTIGVRQGDVLGPEFFRWVILCATSTYNTAVRTTATITPTTYGDLIAHTRGKQDSATGTEFCIPDNVYADDSNIYWCCREDFEKEGPGCVEHFASFGLNMHLGTRGKTSKTECLFCSASPAAYADPSTCDGADLSDIDMGNGKSIQVVHQYPSLGTIISGNSGCEPEINRRIGLGYGSMEMKTKVYGSPYVPWSTQVAIYETITPPIVLYGCRAWTANQGSLDKLEAFNNAACEDQQSQPLAHARVRHHQCLATATGRNANHDELSWLGHVACMPSSRSPNSCSWQSLQTARDTPSSRTVGQSQT